MAIGKGDSVKIKAHIIVGTVVGATVDPESLKINYLVSYTNEEGEATERYFTEDHFAEVTPAEPPAEPAA